MVVAPRARVGLVAGRALPGENIEGPLDGVLAALSVRARKGGGARDLGMLPFESSVDEPAFAFPDSVETRGAPADEQRPATLGNCDVELPKDSAPALVKTAQ